MSANVSFEASTGISEDYAGYAEEVVLSRNDSSESFMLGVLKKSFPEELGGLTQADPQQKPDFQDQTTGIGVEATIAQHDGDNSMIEAHSLFNPLEGKVPTPEEDAKLRKLGMIPFCENGKLVDACESFWEGDSYPAIATAIMSKLAKLNNGNYDAVRDVRLVVKDFRDVRQPKLLAETIRQACTTFSAENCGSRRFTHVYVIPDVQHCVFDYDVASDTIKAQPFVY